MSKTCCFSILFFSGFGLKLEGLGAPRWRQVGSKFHLRVYSVALFDVLTRKIFLKWHLGGLRVRFWGPRSSFLEGSGTIFATFWIPYLYILPPLNWGYHPRNAKILQRLRRLTSFDFNTKRAIGLQWKLHARSKNMFCFSDIDAAAAGAAGADAAAAAAGGWAMIVT